MHSNSNSVYSDVAQEVETTMNSFKNITPKSLPTNIATGQKIVPTPSMADDEFIKSVEVCRAYIKTGEAF